MQILGMKKRAPVKQLENNKYILELIYGPTYAFKDYALQFLGKLFSNSLLKSPKKITVLGATSGDTGSAAIHAFKTNQDINVFILHPHKKVSPMQQKQMTTVNESNIFNLAIDGNFDDCQKIVKELFVDDDIQNKTSLTAINSINWARLIAQVVYYFWSHLQIKTKTLILLYLQEILEIYFLHMLQNKWVFQLNDYMLQQIKMIF